MVAAPVAVVKPLAAAAEGEVVEVVVVKPVRRRTKQRPAASSMNSSLCVDGGGGQIAVKLRSNRGMGRGPAGSSMSFSLWVGVGGEAWGGERKRVRVSERERDFWQRETERSRVRGSQR